MKSCEGARTTAAREPQNRVPLQRAPSQPSKFPGSFAAHETFLPAERAFRGHFRNIFESPPAKNAGSVRAPSQFFAFGRKKQISPKSPPLSLGSAERTQFKNVPKTGPLHTSHSAERTIFFA